jgi:hypothetical protein
MGSFWRAIFGRELGAEALEAVGLGLRMQKGSELGLAIDAMEAVGEAGRAVPMDGRLAAPGELRGLQDVAVFGVYRAKLRQLLERLASMAARRCREATRAAMVGRLRAFWERRALPAPVRGPVERRVLAGPKGAPTARRLEEIGIGGDLALWRGEGRGCGR